MIVVVTGLPRSGTSMLMQMLAAGGLPILNDDSRPADDGNPRGYLEYEPVKALARDSSWMAEAEGKGVKIVAPLLVYLPAGFSYRVILIDRHLDEILASQSRLLRSLGRWSGDPAILRPAFAQQLDRARWWLNQREIPCLELDYTGILTDPAGRAGAIAQFLRCELDETAMAKAVEPKLYRQRGGDIES